MRYERYETNEYIKRVQAYQDPTESMIEDTDSNFNYAYTLVQENQAQSLHFNSMDHPMSEEDEEELDKKRYYNLQKDEKEDDQKQIDELIKSQNARLNAEKPKLTEEKNEIKLIKKATQEKTNVVLSVNKKRKLLNQKIHRIDYLIKKFKTNYRKNQVFLTMTLREIFSLGNKQKNVDLFNMISNSTNYQDQEAYDELINYLDKTGEEIIKEFYGSPEFETFKEENKEGDEAFKQEKKFSFMEKDGFLKLIKNNY